MNTEQNNQSQQAPARPAPLPSPQPQAAPEPITGIVKALGEVNISSPQAKVNETSISDNNGKRIKLNDGTERHPDTIR